MCIKMKKIIFFLIFIVFISSVYSENDDGLIACYDFEETTGEVKEFLDTHNGTASGVLRGVEGKINNTFEYDGVNDVVDVSHNIALNFDNNSFSYEAWVLLNNTGTTGIIIVKQQSGDDFTGTYLYRANTNKFRLQITDTTPGFMDSGVYTTLNEWIHVIGTRNNSGGVAIYINGAVNITGTNIKSGDNVESMRFGLNAQNGQDFFGKIDVVRIYNTYINESRALSLFNGTEGRNCINTNVTKPPFVDIVAPVVSNLNQTPDNITTINALQGVNITADVIDETALDDSTVKLEITYDNISVFVNGSLIVEPVIINFTNKTGDNFRFFIDETTYLSATYNYPETLLENTPHQNDTIDGLNSFLKIEFFNVTNDREQVFYEIMDEEVTDQTTDYYYCNSSYIVGNPVSSSNCALFFQRTSGQSFNHTHTQFSRHRIIPLGIDTSTGELNGVGVTPVSFIIKRGTVGGERFYYINDSYRISAQTSGNNGNTWNDFIGTIDSHIHQINENPREAIIYRVCGNDTSNNSGCSGFVTDIIDFVILPPSLVKILNPVADTYNTTIIIKHTTGFSPTGQDITGYQYDYKRIDLDDWTNIVENNFPLTNFTWDISNFLNADYQIRIIITDELNLISTTISEIFTIQNPLSVTDQLLTTQNELIGQIVEVLEVIGFILLIIIFLVLGVLVNYYFWWFSAILLWLLTIIDALNGTFTQDFATNIVYVLFGFALIFSAIYLQFNRMQSEIEKPDNMYDNFY